MGRKVSNEERLLIEELIESGYKPRGAAMLVGYGERTGYYIKAEMKRRQTERSEKSRLDRLKDVLRGVFNATEEANSGGGRTAWWNKE